MAPGKPLNERQPHRHRIVIAGAGPGGICLGIKLKQAGIDDFVLLERSPAAGGTWFNNRYPGLACDIPSHLYSFEFEQKPDWSRPYATQKEILAYMQHCVDKYGLGPHIRYATDVTGAGWQDAAGLWKVVAGDGTEFVADVFVSALGMFNELQWPDVPGLRDFSGPIVHTARWPEGLDLTGKRVAVVGSAASAVQLIPEVAKQAAQLHVFQRTANWILPKADEPYGADELAQRRRDPSVTRRMRREIFDFFELLMTFDKPDLMAQLERQALENLEAVADPATREKLRPRVPLGSQRPLFSNTFYPAFNRPNVELVTDPIEAFTGKGVVTRPGGARDVDVLVLATGYAANRFLSVIDVTGRDGLCLAAAWRDGPEAYLGIAVSGFPNLFMLYGPNTNNGSILHMLESQADYIVGKLRHMEADGIRWIEVRREAMDAYNAALQREIAAVEAWRTLGTRYYRASSGRVVTQWPHTMTAYRQRTQVPDMEAFAIGRRPVPVC